MVPVSELEHWQPLKGTYIITLRDEKVIKTDRVAIGDSVFVVSAVIVDARRRDVQPFDIPYKDVVSVSQERTNWVVLMAVIAGLTACVVAIVAFPPSLGPIGQ
jgi:hypothetical protein